MATATENTTLLAEEDQPPPKYGQFHLCTLVGTSTLIAIIFIVVGILIGRYALNQKQTTSDTEVNGSLLFTNNNAKSWRVNFKLNAATMDSRVEKFRPEITKIVDYISSGPGSGLGYEWLANVTDTFGSRHVGSKNLENAIDFVVAGAKKQNFDSVYAEPVYNLKNWVRGEETLTMIQPRNHQMPILGVGGSASESNIPAACITVEDAEMMWRMQNRGQKILLKLKITSHPAGTVTSRNTIFEITGSKFPKEVILLTGHFDSWDVGQGAMDDGGGCAVMWQALTTLKNLNLKPRRTIRVVFWTAEEIGGYFGSKQYYENHKSNGESIIFVTENDMGVFKPQNKGTILFRGKNIQIVQSVADILQRLLKVPLTVEKRNTLGGEDIIWWVQEGRPIFSLQHDRTEYYFVFHHTHADTMTVYQPDDLDFTSAVYAAYAYVIANLDESFE